MEFCVSENEDKHANENSALIEPIIGGEIVHGGSQFQSRTIQRGGEEGEDRSVQSKEDSEKFQQDYQVRLPENASRHPASDTWPFCKKRRHRRDSESVHVPEIWRWRWCLGKYSPSNPYSCTIHHVRYYCSESFFLSNPLQLTTLDIIDLHIKNYRDGDLISCFTITNYNKSLVNWKWRLWSPLLIHNF